MARAQVILVIAGAEPRPVSSLRQWEISHSDHSTTPCFCLCSVMNNSPIIQTPFLWRSHQKWNQTEELKLILTYHVSLTPRQILFSERIRTLGKQPQPCSWTLKTKPNLRKPWKSWSGRVQQFMQFKGMSFKQYLPISSTTVMPIENWGMKEGK